MTSHSPTPETDKAMIEEDWREVVIIGFARTLERDRDRLKAECEALRSALRQIALEDPTREYASVIGRIQLTPLAGRGD